MLLLRTVVVSTLLAAASAPVFANAALATKHQCLACHAPDKKVVGPSYQEVAKKYAGQKDAEAKLAESIRKGGQGKWGPVPMPPQPAVPDADVKTLSKWILGGAK